jgi:transcriptional regulator with XRE-family HTH domain
MTDGERIKRWRKFRGLTAKELAVLAGVSRQTIVAWEGDKWRPSEAHEPKLASALGFRMPSQAPSFPDPPADKRRAS